MKEVTLQIPEGMRLGQAIMNAYRQDWFKTDQCHYHGDTHGYWDIWEEDVEDIQLKINKHSDDTTKNYGRTKRRL